MHSRCCWPPESANADCFSLSFTSSQSAALDERLLDDVVETLALAGDAGPERDVVVDRLRERVRALEHHADAAAHLDRVDVRAVEVVAVVGDAPPTPRAGDEVVHAVERAQQRALAATRRPDQRRDAGAGARRARRPRPRPSCRTSDRRRPATLEARPRRQGWAPRVRRGVASGSSFRRGDCGRRRRRPLLHPVRQRTRSTFRSDGVGTQHRGSDCGSPSAPLMAMVGTAAGRTVWYGWPGGEPAVNSRRSGARDQRARGQTR